MCGCEHQYGVSYCHSDVARLRITDTNKMRILILKSTTNRYKIEHRSLSDSVPSLLQIEVGRNKVNQYVPGRTQKPL